MRESRAMPVPDGVDGMRADAGVARILGLSRTVAASLADAGEVTVDGLAVPKSAKLAAGSWLEVLLPPVAEPLRVEPTPVADLGVIYHDSDIIVVDKPIGVAAHPSQGWEGPTVVGALDALGYRISTSGAAERQGIVSRLDVGTSGLMVVAASEHGYSVLKRAFREREVSKGYHALVQGHLDPPSGTIDAPIGRHRGADWKFAVTTEGKPSITHYDTVEMFAAASLLDIHLETGRTHQIRVHMAAMRHPCCGDETYGADPVLAQRLGLTRQWLHARSLGFAHPADGRWVEFVSEYPADLQHALDVLRDG